MSTIPKSFWALSSDKTASIRWVELITRSKQAEIRLHLHRICEFTTMLCFCRRILILHRKWPILSIIFPVTSYPFFVQALQPSQEWLFSQSSLALGTQRSAYGLHFLYRSSIFSGDCISVECAPERFTISRRASGFSSMGQGHSMF